MSNIVEHNVISARRDRATANINRASRRIFVKFQKEGIHCYPAAATNPALVECSFLANPHRHMFHFRVEIEVTHSDRDIEFIIFKRWLESLYGNGTLNLDHKSCEMIADDLYLQIAILYPGRDVKIEISEDCENGAIIEYNDTTSNLRDDKLLS